MINLCNLVSSSLSCLTLPAGALSRRCCSVEGTAAKATVESQIVDTAASAFWNVGFIGSWERAVGREGMNGSNSFHSWTRAGGTMIRVVVVKRAEFG